MADLSTLELLGVALIFIWSGFVRSGLGFGGAVLALPFLLLIHDDALLFLPLIAVHLIVFSVWITWRSHRDARRAQPDSQNDQRADWDYLRRALKVMIVPKMLGVLGLLTLPPRITSVIILLVVSFYALGYVINRPIQVKNVWMERALLAGGAYFSGTSLTGAPLIIPAFASRVSKFRLRNTLFVLWLILTVIKLGSFLAFGVDLQLVHHLWLFPCALVGHLIGERFHHQIVAAETPRFFQVLGVTLLAVSGVGLLKAFEVLA
ncbi:MAG: sulfite exporter TauE/SafE family protein [Betaproteobacteria bacterium]|nr:sulfite exporter TauE/SafE family protein [Betaproteobacteria bacterium]